MLERYAPATGVSTAIQPGQSLPDATASRNAWLEIDLAALQSNLAAVRSRLTPGTGITAVVKANAYGHGAVPVTLALEQAGVSSFAVAWLEEGLALRDAGVRGEILVLEHGFPAGAPAAIAARLTCTVHSPEMALACSRAAVAAGTVASVQVKVDTGLHRFGNEPAAAIALANYCRELPGVAVEALWTHMANADEADDSFSLAQLERFDEVRRALPWIPRAHAANSATALRRPELHLDAVRVGLALYGLVPGNTPDPGLVPVMSLKARLARVHRLAQGEGVSYGLTWRAPRDSIVGLVPVGYGDGWRRSLGNGSSVLVRGQRCPVVGRVCMDQLLVDLTPLGPTPGEGDEVVLLGRQGDETITANEIARLAGTISWDIVSSLLPRLPRFAHRSGWLTAVA